jgi:hypothetical protein
MESISLPFGIEYWYSGKPSGDLVVRGYTNLDVESWAPKRDGVTFAMVYLNIDPTFASGKDIGALRVRLIREPFGSDGNDATAYNDFVIIGNHLITHVWFEKGEANRPLHWEMDCRYGLEKAVIGTRYAKFFTIPFFFNVPDTAGLVQAQNTVIEGMARTINTLSSSVDTLGATVASVKAKTDSIVSAIRTFGGRV